jgi:uncharacterized protein (DUF2236 family)
VAWLNGADSEAGATLAGRVQHVHRLLDEHLDTEEKDALSLVKEHITAAEWGQMLGASSADVPPEQQALIFGMMIHDADPDIVADTVAGMPSELRAIIEPAARQAYTTHVRTLQGAQR